MTHQSSPAYSFGGRTKAQVEPSYMHSPGPGSYKISSSDFRAHSTGFGKGPRNPMTNKSLSPAPGQYEISDFLELRNKKNSRVKQPRYVRKANQSNSISLPGPGTYNPISYNRSPKYSLGNRTSSPQAFTNRVGPGQYDTNEEHMFRRSFRIGNGGRSSLVINEKFPGPGTYNYKERKGAQWSFGKDQRLKQINKQEPGPGHYDYLQTVVNPPKYLISSPDVSIKL